MFCNTKTIPTSEVLIVLQAENQFLFSTYNPQFVNLECANFSTKMWLNGTNKIKLTENCILTTNRYQLSKNSILYYSKIENNASRALEYKFEPFMIKKDEKYSRQIDNLNALINQNEKVSIKIEDKVESTLNTFPERKLSKDNVKSTFSWDFSLWTMFWSLIPESWAFNKYWRFNIGNFDFILYFIMSSA